MKADLTVYQDKEGRFRWRFLVDDDIRAISSDGYATEEEAIRWAEIIVLSPWYRTHTHPSKDVQCRYSSKEPWWRRFW